MFLNGRHLARHSSGYLGFDIRLDNVVPGLLQTGQTQPQARAEALGEAEGEVEDQGQDRAAAAAAAAPGPNVLAVRVDASFGSGHWYEGGGILRPVHLVHTAATLRFATDGLVAQSTASTLTAASATVVPSAELVSDAAATAVVRYTLVDQATGATVSSAATAATAVAGTGAPSTVAGAQLTVRAPRLWSVHRPALYTLVATLLVVRGGASVAVDTLNVSFGLRTIDWAAPGGGFALNGAPLHLRGFSHHGDFGGVGGAVPDRVNLFRANALRSVGGNIWRTSHNPYRPALYDILDAVGVLCWDENRDFARPYAADMEALVRRDRNHPSVVIWSAGNEAELYSNGLANQTMSLFRTAAKKWDTSRPFSANQNTYYGTGTALNETINNMARFLDVEGYSHGSIASAGAAAVHRTFPDRPVVSGECCSCEMQRGEDFPTATVLYPSSLEQAQCMVSCTQRIDPNWRGHPSPTQGVIAGSVGVWTLFDYAGEPGHSASSREFRVSSSFGQFDYAGFPKSAAFWYRALWLAAVPEADPGRPPLPASHVVRISQAWNCPPQNRSVAPASLAVQVFSDLPEIELFLDGKSIGIAVCTPGSFAGFDAVPYTRGNLTAVGRAKPGGSVLAHHTELPAGPPAAVELAIDVPSAATGTGSALLLDGHDAGLVRATVRDAQGRVVSCSGPAAGAPVITFAVTSGPGRVVGVHNGDAASHEPQYSAVRRAYHGLARAVVKVTADVASGSPGDLALLASDIELDPTSPLTQLAPAAGPIVVTATSPGLEPGLVRIPVSADAAKHGVRATAAAAAAQRSALRFE